MLPTISFEQLEQTDKETPKNPEECLTYYHKLLRDCIGAMRKRNEEIKKVRESVDNTSRTHKERKAALISLGLFSADLLRQLDQGVQELLAPYKLRETELKKEIDFLKEAANSWATLIKLNQSVLQGDNFQDPAFKNLIKDIQNSAQKLFKIAQEEGVFSQDKDALRVVKQQARDFLWISIFFNLRQIYNNSLERKENKTTPYDQITTLPPSLQEKFQEYQDPVSLEFIQIPVCISNSSGYKYYFDLKSLLQCILSSHEENIDSLFQNLYNQVHNDSSNLKEILERSVSTTGTVLGRSFKNPLSRETILSSSISEAHEEYFQILSDRIIAEKSKAELGNSGFFTTGSKNPGEETNANTSSMNPKV